MLQVSKNSYISTYSKSMVGWWLAGLDTVVYANELHFRAAQGVFILLELDDDRVLWSIDQNHVGAG